MTRGLALFEEVGGLLNEHCVKCHGGEKTKSDFDLTTREGLLAGGAEGVAVVPFDAGASLMMKMMRHEEEPSMPDKKPKLPDEVIDRIAAWIDLGAPYEAPLIAGKTPPRDKSKVSAEDRKWWSFLPLSHPAVPAGAPHPIDAFLLAKAADRKLALNPAADPRTLLRRAHLTLTGLPPSAAEAAAFATAAGADLPGAMASLADRLLASPHFGERWARHWLDVARFAESSGFEHDYDRPHAWHFRDFVIRAINRDMPYDQFMNWQLAGDEFEPGNAEAMMATGFLGAGVYPTQITANEVERVRYDALDDMLATTSSAMLGLTVGCARCHDHKFDPFPANDYYRLLSTFTTTVRSNIDLDLQDEASVAARANHAAEQERLAAGRAAWEATTLRPEFDRWVAGNPAAPVGTVWTLADGGIESKGGATFARQPDGSWLAAGANPASDIYTITTTVDAEVSAIKIEALADPTLRHKGPGRAENGNFALSRIRVSARPAGGGEAREIALQPGEFTHQQNAGGLSVAASLDDQPSTGWAVDGQIGNDHAAIFTFAEPVRFAGGSHLTVTLEFSVNTGHHIGRPRISLCTGGAPVLKAPAVPAAVAALLAKLPAAATLAAAERDTLFAWWKTNHPGWLEQDAAIARHAASRPVSAAKVMVCAEGYDPIVMHSQGPPFFNETHALKRGDPNQKTGVARQGFLQVLMRDADEKRWQWTPPAGSKSSGRRRSMAGWLTDVEHGAGALAARVAVNRVWQHHFGRGIVGSPNDFGKTGDAPTHPELLDWLAGELIRNGWKLKAIHRLILTSEAWRQSTATSAAKRAADPDNKLILRASPRRLEAEVARDAILAVSGQLDPQPFGPGTLDENSRRRSIYFTVKRSQLVNSMVVFDAPEPLASQGTRPTTTVAPQALFLMNSPQARAWAAAMTAKVWPAGTVEERINQAYLATLGREAAADELALVLPFLEAQASRHRDAGQPEPDAAISAFTDYCQTLFSLNEFLYIP